MSYAVSDVISDMPYGERFPNKKPTPQQVDELAERLVVQLECPQLKKWYCGVIYKFGLLAVETWLRRSKEGRVPAALFAHYVAGASGYRKQKQGGHGV